MKTAKTVKTAKTAKTVKTAKTAIEHCVRVAYMGQPDARDSQLRKAVGRSPDDSGYCLLDGERDLAWYFKQERAATAAAGRVRAARVPGTTVAVRSE